MHVVLQLFDAALVANNQHAASWHGWGLLEKRQGNFRKARDLWMKVCKSSQQILCRLIVKLLPLLLLFVNLSCACIDASVLHNAYVALAQLDLQQRQHIYHVFVCVFVCACPRTSLPVPCSM